MQFWPPSSSWIFLDFWYVCNLFKVQLTFAVDWLDWLLSVFLLQIWTVNNKPLVQAAAETMESTDWFVVRQFVSVHHKTKTQQTHTKFHRSVSIFTRKWLRYVRVFAITNPSVVCLSVTLVHPTQGVEAFGNISSPLCTLAILWPPCKILRRQCQGNPSIVGDIRNRGSEIERCWTYRRLYLINGTRQTYGFY